MSSAGVVSTQSPRDRSRRIATRLPRGRHSRILGTLLFDFRLVHEHHWDIVPDRVYTVALNTLQAAAVRFQVERGLTQRAHEDFKQIFADRHMRSIQCIKVRRRSWNWTPAPFSYHFALADGVRKV